MLLHMNGKFTMVKLQVIEINCFYTTGIEKENLKTNSSIYIFFVQKMAYMDHEMFIFRS